MPTVIPCDPRPHLVIHEKPRPMAANFTTRACVLPPARVRGEALLIPAGIDAWSMRARRSLGHWHLDCQVTGAGQVLGLDRRPVWHSFVAVEISAAVPDLGLILPTATLRSHLRAFLAELGVAEDPHWPGEVGLPGL